jgi:hypothetical protein
MAGKGPTPRPFSVSYETYGENHERIFGKKLTPEEWCKLKDIKIIDPDGWRVDNTSFTKPITESEFYKRLNTSTIQTQIKS